MSDQESWAAELRERTDLLAADIAERIDPARDVAEGADDEAAPARREGVAAKWARDYAALRESAAASALPSEPVWVAARVREAAAAWVYGTAVVRFCEDAALTGPVWFAGHDGRPDAARAAQAAYFAAHPPTHTDREFLGTAFAHFTRLPATRALFGRGSALRLVSPSVAGSQGLVDYWRRAGEDGRVRRRFTGADPGVLLEWYARRGTDERELPAAVLGVTPVGEMLRTFTSIVADLRAAGCATLDELPG